MRVAMVVGGVVIVAALGALLALRADDEPAAAVTPTPTDSTPAATPTPTEVPDVIPGLPPTLPLPPGLLEEVTPGWVLATYASEPIPDGGLVAHTVVLAAPTGELYRVLDLPVEPRVTILDWVAGSTTAVVSVEGQGDDGAAAVPRAELDLTTGTIAPRPVPADWNEGAYWFFEGIGPDGAELWSTPTSEDGYTSDLYAVPPDGAARRVGGIGLSMLLDPGGQRVVSPYPGPDEVFQVMDLITGAATTHGYGAPGKKCQVVGWLDPDALLAFCVAADFPRWTREPSGRSEDEDWAAADPSMFRVDLETQQTTPLARLTRADPVPDTWNGTWRRSGEVIYVGGYALQDPSSCPTGTFVWQGSTSNLLQEPASRVVRVGDRLLTEGPVACDDPRPKAVVDRSVASGTSTILLPVPPATPEFSQWASGLASWAVGR